MTQPDLTVPLEAYEAAARAPLMHSLLQHNFGFDMPDCHCAAIPGLREAVDAAIAVDRPLAVAEGRRLERDDHAPKHKAEIAEVVREIVALATDPDGPTAEWLDLIKSVAEGHYTPRIAEGRTDE
jgi:hypothetical protein